jgi:hypothetical protein
MAARGGVVQSCLVVSRGWRSWLPVWSTPSALRAVRAAAVVPAVFAFGLVVGNLQPAAFAAFGGFATLVLAGSAGSRREKLIARTCGAWSAAPCACG